jgi:hypothetical protein
LIRTVTALRDEDRERRNARQHAQNKAEAARFRQVFRADRDDGAQASKPTAPDGWARPWA